MELKRRKNKMMLDRFVETNLLILNPSNNLDQSIESTILSVLIIIISLSLFIFWKKKKALLNFQAWALLVTLINIIFFFNYCPFMPHICLEDGSQYQLTTFAKVFLRFLQFLTSGVTIWKMWKISEKYLPPKLFYNRQFTNNKSNLKIFARGLAILHTIKHGGNDIENDEKTKKNILKSIKKRKNIYESTNK
jgi:hypothetical protein